MVNVYVGLMQYPDYSHVFFVCAKQSQHFSVGCWRERVLRMFLKGLGYQENTWFFTSFGRTTTNSVLQMVVFLWGFTVLFGFLSSYWIWQPGERVSSTGRAEVAGAFRAWKLRRTVLTDLLFVTKSTRPLTALNTSRFGTKRALRLQSSFEPTTKVTGSHFRTSSRTCGLKTPGKAPASYSFVFAVC